MVVIRLARGGAKKAPFYHLTVADSRRARGGRFIEQVGFFNPVARGQQDRLKLNIERIEYWMSQGARLSERVSHLLKEAKLTEEEGEKLATWRKERHIRRKKAAKAEAAAGAPEDAKIEETAAAAEPAADTGETQQPKAQETAAAPAQETAAAAEPAAAAEETQEKKAGEAAVSPVSSPGEQSEDKGSKSS